MIRYDDNTPLHFGTKYQGQKLRNVPASYKLWLLENCRINASLKQYIESNLQLLKQEAKLNAKSIRR
jgi:uncharacterized protein (DUF3820 family)